jgi:DNA-binding MarR family transcriptional regulator
MDSNRPSSRPGKRRHVVSSEQEVFLNLWRTYDCLKQLEDRLFSEHQLSAQQYNALRLLQAVHPGTMPTLKLGQALITRAPDMPRMLDRLERRGLIARERRPENRRVVQVGITPVGLELLETMAAAVREMHAMQLGHLSAKEQRELIRLLKRARQPHQNVRLDWLDE